MVKEVIVTAALLVFTGGCDLFDSGIQKEDPFITGEITDRKEGKAYHSILVEENPDVSEPTEPGGTKIWLIITNETNIYTRAENGSISKSNAGALAMGQQAEAWVSGPVDDTYPLQGTASQIAVIQDE